LLGLQEPITAELPELTWQDSVWLVGLFITTAAILHVAFFYLIAGPLMVMFFFGSWPPPILPPGWGELAIVAIINGLILAVRARHRLWDWTYCAPALLLALWPVGLFISDAAGEYKSEEVFRQSIADYKDIEARMRDPNFLMTLKPPISSTCQSAVFAALNSGQRTPGVPLTSAEVHAVLTNLGSDPEIEEGVALSPVTSVDDLQWLALHGNEDTRADVGQNPHTPPETRRQLMNDLDVVSYRIGITAAARLCDPELNRMFWNRESRRDLPKIDLAYQELAASPCTPKDILRKLETFPDPVGASAAATLRSHPGR